jgi:hypothetical protein
MAASGLDTFLFAPLNSPPQAAIPTNPKTTKRFISRSPIHNYQLQFLPRLFLTLDP